MSHRQHHHHHHHNITVESNIIDTELTNEHPTADISPPPSSAMLSDKAVHFVAGG